MKNTTTKQTTSNRSQVRRATAMSVAVLLGLGGALSACSSDTEEGTDTTTSVADESQKASDELAIEGAWARTSPSSATAGAVYFKIANPTDTDDVLTAASVPSSVAARTELHESKMESGSGDDMGGGQGGDMTTTTGGQGDGMMTMKKVDEIKVPAGETVTLEPGGLHVMLMELAAPLEVGDTIEVTLTFDECR
ncbi:MAG: copper chaperone PCu(A)C [Microthrixaceae bacterium]